MLLQEFWDDRYVGYCERLREVTRVGYESAWRCHVEPVFGSMELADIGVDDIELWLSGFAGPGAARKAWAVLRQMLRKAAKWGYLEVDVTRLEIDLPVKPLYVPRLLTIGQTRRQLQGFYGHALEAWLIVDSCLALRPEEGYGVDWADIDMRSGITHIQQRLHGAVGYRIGVPVAFRDLHEPEVDAGRFGGRGLAAADAALPFADVRAAIRERDALREHQGHRRQNRGQHGRQSAARLRVAGLAPVENGHISFSPSGGYDMAPAGIGRGRKAKAVMAASCAPRV